MTTARRLAALLDEARLATDQEPLGADLTEATCLFDVMDSLVIAVLIVLIEEEWAIDIGDEMIDADAFETLQTLAAFVDGAASG